ncbi:response regulator [Solimonas terrae]|uniref:Response regulator n=1 Tax=Solimonas terrae TaxID=1396819 RepID=A0A6M2BYY8_9GAMM|nr:response regulator [Solimonas terrae]NGY07019.1 response regulator [Solimonas terrae]
MNIANPISKPRVLFVDDEPRVLVALKVIFRDHYDVQTATSGAAAIEALQAQTFDVVVSDQRMPGMTGIEVLRSAKQLQPKSMRILLTGYSDLNATVDAINEGEVFRFVTKPWSNDKLRATLASAVEAATTDVPPEAAAPIEALPDAQLREGSQSAVGVLVLDPDAETRTALKNTLGRERPVYCAASLDEGLGLLASHRIGVIVAELMLEGEDLSLALGALRLHDPSLVAIVLTSQADAQRAITLINQSQVYRLLRKPVSDPLLRGTVNLASQRFTTLSKHPELVRRNETEMPAEPAARTASIGMLARIKRLLLR